MADIKTASKISEHDLDKKFLEKMATVEFVQEQLAGVSADGIPKLVSIPVELVAEEDGQTEFIIELETFDVTTDTVLVLDGRGMLLPNTDFTISGNKITVVRGWDAGDVGGAIILKNVPMGDGGMVNGSVMKEGSIPLDRLAENVPTVEYVENALAGIAADGIPKLTVIPLEIVAETEGQTEFEIELETFDASTDTVLVLDGRGVLLPGTDFTVSGKKVTLVEGWKQGYVGGLLVMKNVPMGDGGTVSGVVLAPGSVPARALVEKYALYEDHQIQSKTGLSHLGLTAGSETILDIIKNIPKNTEIQYAMSQETCNKEEYPGAYGIFRAHRSNDSRVSLEFETIIGSNINDVTRWVGNGISNGDNSTWSGWKKNYNETNPPTASDVGALPVSGGTLTGNLDIETGLTHRGIFSSNDTDTFMAHYRKADDSQALLGVKLESDNSAKAYINKYVNGNWQPSIELFGEHNHGMTLLWSNASPTSTFAEQTISLDLSEYDMVMIFCGLDVNDLSHNSISLLKNSSGVCNMEGGGKFYGRHFSISDSGVFVANDYYYNTYGSSSVISNNKLVIPRHIFGIKY